jgi:hypothetical protein
MSIRNLILIRRRRIFRKKAKLYIGHETAHPVKDNTKDQIQLYKHTHILVAFVGKCPRVKAVRAFHVASPWEDPPLARDYRANGKVKASHPNIRPVRPPTTLSWKRMLWYVTKQDSALTAVHADVVAWLKSHPYKQKADAATTTFASEVKQFLSQPTPSVAAQKKLR